MPFIGKNPTAGFATIVKDDFTADGSTTVFTLSKIATVNDIAVYVGNVRQEPTDAYTVNGTTLTMSAAPATGVNFYVLHIAGTIESSVVPPDGSIGSAKLIYPLTTFSSTGIDDNATSTAMTIDSGENLLVGKTTAGSGNAGVQLEAGGRGGFTKNDAYVTFQNRLSSDGEVSRFMKDGTKVGSIDSRGGIALTLNSESGNGRLAQGGTAYYEWNTTRLSPVTDTVGDLGRSVQRWKDLYLSGGAYIGGTGSANYLDDYEEGTWTPALQDGSGNAYTTGSGTYGNYTKIGNQVFVTGRVNPTAANSANLNLEVTGLPFTGISQGRCGGTFSFADFGVPSGFEQIFLGLDGSFTKVDLRKQSTSGTAGLSATDIGTDDFGFSLTYIAQ